MNLRPGILLPFLLGLAACDAPAPPAMVASQPAAVGQAPALVPGPPPPAQTEFIPAPPIGPGSLAWQPGHWQWTGQSPQPWQWQEGRHAQVPMGLRIWVPGRWVQAPTGGWTWIDGRWAA